MHVCFPKYLSMGTTRNKIETEERGEKRRMNVEKSTAGRKKINCSMGLPYRQGRYFLKQWMNYQTKNTYNPFTAAPGGRRGVQVREQSA